MRPGYDRGNPYQPRDVSRVKGVTIHYTASPPSTTILAIANYQTGPGAQESFPGIAYHLVVDEVGDVHLCQDLDRYVWHSAGPGANDATIGLCYTGNHEPNEAQLQGLRSAIKWCEAQLGRSLTIHGHKDNYATACPGPTWPSWKEKVT